MVDVSATPSDGFRAMPLGWLRRIAGLGVPYLSLAIFALVVIAAIGGEALAPHDPNGLDLSAAFRPPVWRAGGSLDHLLGTDSLGRDIFSRIIAGARISLTVAVYAIVVSGGIGSLVGMIAGYFGRWVDAAIMRLVDIQMSIPSLALALVIATVLSPSLTTVIVVISITY
jgi:peptide/nickel transport system permease protein